MASYSITFEAFGEQELKEILEELRECIKPSDFQRDAILHMPVDGSMYLNEDCDIELNRHE